LNCTDSVVLLVLHFTTLNIDGDSYGSIHREQNVGAYCRCYKMLKIKT